MQKIKISGYGKRGGGSQVGLRLVTRLDWRRETFDGWARNGFGGRQGRGWRGGRANKVGSSASRYSKAEK